MTTNNHARTLAALIIGSSVLTLIAVAATPHQGTPPMTNEDRCTSHAANVLLYWAGLGGYPPGEWTRLLLDLLAKSDRTNRAKLTETYPELGAAMNLYKDHINGVDILRDIAHSGSTTDLQDLAVATTHLGERAGCTSFQMTWDCPHTPDVEDDHNCPDVRWHASIDWRGTRLIMTAPDPGEALQAICADLLNAAECRCGKPVHVEGEPPIEGGCTWSRDRDRWVPGCDADPIRVSGTRAPRPTTKGTNP